LHANWLQVKTDQRGVTAMKYGLIGGTVVVAILGGVEVLADIDATDFVIFNALF
jgi:Flp pilus assembly pilin Flp